MSKELMFWGLIKTLYESIVFILTVYKLYNINRRSVLLKFWI